jgi:methionyl-tRNA formyltransferase
MDDGIDTGDIISQIKIPITADVDLGLLYQCLLWLKEKYLS